MESDDVSIHEAISDGDVDLFSSLIDSVDINAKNEHGETPLHLAARKENLFVKMFVKKLIVAGFNVNAKDDEHDTPLHRAASIYRNTENVRRLIEAGADVNATNGDGETPLHRAEAEASKLLIAAGANVNAVNRDGDTPLHTVHDIDAQEEAKKALFLIKAGANPTIRNGVGKLPEETATREWRASDAPAIIRAARIAYETQALQQVAANDPAPAPRVMRRRL